MISALRLDERLRFYEEVIEILFYGHIDLYERLDFIQKHELPTTLVAISSELHKLKSMPEAIEGFESHNEEMQILISVIDTEGFFDGWDVLLILAYIQHINSNADFLGIYNEFQPSDIINAIGTKLYQVYDELSKSFSFLEKDLKTGDNQRQSDADSYYYLKETFKNFLEDYVLESYDEKVGKHTRNEILIKMKSLYYSLDSLDGGEFKNMYEFIGLIRYHGSNHGLYEVVNEQVRNDIENYFLKCSFDQRLSMLAETDLSNLINNIEVDSLEGVEDFKEHVLHAEEFQQVIDDLKKAFMYDVPKYDPYE